MKKITLWILLSVLLFSCSNEDLIEDLINKEVETSDLPALKTAGDGMYDVLGYGYDITEAPMDDGSVKYKVLNITRLMENEKNNPKLYYDRPLIARTSTRFWGGEDFNSFSKEMITKLSVSGSVSVLNLGTDKKGVFTGSAKYTSERENKYSYSSKYSFSCAEVLRRHRRLILESRDFSIFSKYLDPYFQTYLDNLTTSAQADAIVKKFGSHVLLDITIGGSLRSYYRSTLVEESSSTTKKDAVEAGAKVALTKIGINVDASWSNTTTIANNKKNKDIEGSIIGTGGSTNGLSLSIDKDGNTSYNIRIESWESSITDGSSQLVDVDWNGVFPIFDFVTDATKKDLLKAAVKRYIDSKNIEVLDLIPLYAVFNTGCDDSHFFYNWNDVVNSKDKYSGVDGYILSKPHKDYKTKPMYMLFSKNNNDSYYLFDEKKYQQSPDQKYGIAGYVLAEPYGDITRTMYRLFNNNKIRDTHYVYDWTDVIKSNDIYEGIDGYIFK